MRRKAEKQDYTKMLEKMYITVNHTEEENRRYVKRGVIGFVFGMILCIAVPVILVVSIAVKADDQSTIISLVCAGICGIISLVLFVKSFPALALHDDMKINEKYAGEKLYELPSMQKSTVKAKLLANGFEFADGYYRKESTFLKEPVTCFFRMTECIDMEGSIEHEVDRLEELENKNNRKNKKKLNCLCLLLYLNHMDEECRVFMKELGKTCIGVDGDISPYLDIRIMVIAVDQENGNGYFLDSIEQSRSSMYSKGCKAVKGIFE